MLEYLERAALDRQALVVRQGENISAAEVSERAGRCADWLIQQKTPVVAFTLENSLDWLAIDFACMKAKKTALPIPDFFSPQQRQHALQSSGCTLYISGFPKSGQSIVEAERSSAVTPVSIPGLIESVRIQRFAHDPVVIPADTAKITFTSGSTGNPKGVCLSDALLTQVATSLAQVLGDLQLRRHLCLLPLAVLLENVAGLYCALIAGGACILASGAQTGFDGAGKFNAETCKRFIAESKPDSLILLPQLLHALLEHEDVLWAKSLRFIAVGGAAVPEALMLRAEKLGLPVYQGYGLSECGSVVSLNLPGSSMKNSVGRALPHVKTRVDTTGELFVSGPKFSGYLGDNPPVLSDGNDEWLATGDIVAIEDAFLYIKGRSKNLIITSYGRNISPEWIESSLLSAPQILQCMVLGEGRTSLVALLYVAENTTQADIGNAIEKVNSGLPDYAKISGWHTVKERFSVANDCLTANGRLRREKIQAYFADDIAALFAEKTFAG
ncbi:MAG: AMP-binding protein [Pseudomonadales bacterium]|nr:AMP-binding protein [Pseudomonadales bacterium]